MSIPSGFHSIFLSCNNGINMFVDADSVSGYNPFLSTQPLEDPPSYNTHHAPRSNFVNICNSGTPIDHHDLLNHPSLMRTICDSSRPTHRRSSHSVTRIAPTQKRWNHNMIEKQRRKDMKTLFSRLRSLLPEENLRGKRAESDQVLGAVNYICHLQQKIEKLSRERERMKADFDRKEQVSFVGVQFSSDEKFFGKRPGLQGSEGKFPTVKINSVRSGVKISLNAFEDQIVYSNLLLALEAFGLEVVNATSSSINNTVFHTIHNKVSDIGYYNMDDLYDKLRHLISDNQADPRALEARDECLLPH